MLLSATSNCVRRSLRCRAIRLDGLLKITYEVKPNPSRIYGAEQAVVYYYLEEYNLLKNKSPNYYTRVLRDEFPRERGDHTQPDEEPDQ